MDLGDPDLYVDEGRYARWRRSAEADEVVWSEPGSSPGGFWSVFSHRLSREVLAPTAPFTSEYGMMIGFDAENPDRSGGQMLVVTDGPAHAALRRVVGPSMSRVAATRLEPLIRAEVAALLDAAEGGEVDVAADLGPRLPAAVVCEVFGVPQQEREQLITLTNHAFGGNDSSFDRMTSSHAHAEILMFFHDLIAHRRRNPGDDLVSALLAQPGMTTREVLVNCDNVLVGGNETTRHAITACFHALALTPGLLEAVADDQVRRGAVEEVLRWSSPAMHLLRVATADVRLGDRTVTAGQAVAVWLPAANSDERVFPQPRRFDPARRPNPHLGFGNGPHHCLGASIARAEIDALLRALAARVRSVQLQGEPVWMRSNLVQGYRRLQVAIEPAAVPV